MSSLNLKGLWIPIEILTDKNLSDKEKHIYSLVIFLSQEKQYCFCTNKTISELLNISVTQVSKLVNSLKDKGYINIEMVYKENSKEVDIRKLIPIEEKFKDNKYNIKILIIKGFAILNKEITKKKALILIDYMQVIILHRRYAIKQNIKCRFCYK